MNYFHSHIVYPKQSLISTSSGTFTAVLLSHNHVTTWHQLNTPIAILYPWHSFPLTITDQSW